MSETLDKLAPGSMVTSEQFVQIIKETVIELVFDDVLRKLKRDLCLNSDAER